jgi:hypothetical protein
MIRVRKTKKKEIIHILKASAFKMHCIRGSFRTRLIFSERFIKTKMGSGRIY